jgi:ectoine hydroxylase-related dioxygenase (phytanoyl-CoA dioxygenase family)
MTTAGVEQVTVETPLDEVVALILRDGAIIIRELVDGETMERILAELEPWMRRVKPGTADWVGHRTKRMHGLVAKSPAVRELVVNETILAIMDNLLLPWCDNYQLGSCSLTSIGPGERAQELHRDDLMFPFAHPTERIATCTTFWAVSDFTERNGATRLVPGSHRWDDERRPREDETVPAVMPRGSVEIYVGSLWHGGGANVTSDEWRHAMYTSYSLGWLKQEEAQFLVNPPAIARRYPERLQRLIGYQMHKPFLGWYDLQDPIVVLRDYEELSQGALDHAPDGQSEIGLRKSVRRL